MRIAVVAPSCPLAPKAADAVEKIVRDRGDCELLVHPQCFLADGHFAGSDQERLSALRDVMADESVDAVWFARGGYGANRIAEEAARNLPPAAAAKTFMGYSDTGFLLASLHKAGLNVAHGPMPQDSVRDGGEAAVARALVTVDELGHVPRFLDRQRTGFAERHVRPDDVPEVDLPPLAVFGCDLVGGALGRHGGVEARSIDYPIAVLVNLRSLAYLALLPGRHTPGEPADAVSRVAALIWSSPGPPGSKAR